MICRYLEEKILHFPYKLGAAIVPGINDNFEKMYNENMYT